MKSRIKRLAFLLADLAGLNALARRRHAGAIKVLLYHNIMPGAAHFGYAITPEDFDRQLAYLKQHYNFVSIDQSGNWQGLRGDRVNLLITFDDGFANNLTYAAPLLEKHDIAGVFFLIADCVGEGAVPGFQHSRKRAGSPDAVYRTLTAHDARQMRAMGMTIGSHSLAHEDHRAMSDDTALEEARRARSTLEAALDEPVALFAFPWGFHNPGQDMALAQVYHRVFLTRHGFAQADDVVIPRNEVTDLAQLKLAASGALDGIRRRLGL